METKTGLISQIENEIKSYLTEVVPIGENYDFSQYKLTKRISMFENKIYPTGKFDSQGNYKYWFDIITTRIEAEIKNIDFDTKNVVAYSDAKIDELPCLIVNLKLKEYLRETCQAEEINSAIEEGSGWGNVVWKKIKEGYERVDLKNFYVINQTAQTLNETPAIERHQLSQSDLRAKQDSWDYVDEVIKECKTNSYKSEIGTQEKDTTVPYYDIYERNGEVCLYDLKEYNEEEPKEKDKDKYVLARVVAAGKKGTISGVEIKHIMFAGEIKKMPYEEYHRSRYKGRWWREGLYELIMDLQVRGNQIGNQLAQGLEFAGKLVLSSSDRLIIQNIITDMKNGDIVKTQDLKQVDLRMHAADQLFAEWNRIIELANEIANSREIVMGDATPNQPFRLGALLNTNANKLFDFIREKLAIPFSKMFEKGTIPELIKELKAKEILRLTGDSDILARIQQIIVDDWYISNLVNFPPHTKEIADELKAQQLEELKKRPQLLMKGTETLFENFKPRVSVIITGEQVNLDSDLQTLGSFAQLEADPVRRSAILELMARKKGLDFGSLPKSPPMQPMKPMPTRETAMAGAENMI